MLILNVSILNRKNRSKNLTRMARTTTRTLRPTPKAHSLCLCGQGVWIAWEYENGTEFDVNNHPGPDLEPKAQINT